MAIEAGGLVLREDQNLADFAIEAIGQREIDDAVQPAEGDRRLRPIASQRLEPCPLAPGKDDGQDIFHDALRWFGPSEALL